jgi:hypothetical protein
MNRVLRRVCWRKSSGFCGWISNMATVRSHDGQAGIITLPAPGDGE